eukprot:Nitzschia sp. Nitz4//scaffold21_size171442//42089//43438//NITZ4_002152-RA/size171442-processed-gene-0.7-mRNA-1//1//CDS//3329542384//1712//frame0
MEGSPEIVSDEPLASKTPSDSNSPVDVTPMQSPSAHVTLDPLQVKPTYEISKDSLPVASTAVETRKANDPPGWSGLLKSQQYAYAAYWSDSPNISSQQPVPSTPQDPTANSVNSPSDDNSSFYRWVPPPIETPQYIPPRDREAQQVYDNSVPYRSWAIHRSDPTDGDRSIRSERSLSLLPPTPLGIQYIKQGGNSLGSTAEEYEEVEEEVIEEQEVTITSGDEEEIIIEEQELTVDSEVEEIIEEDVTSQDDDEGFGIVEEVTTDDEEIVDEVLTVSHMSSSHLSALSNEQSSHRSIPTQQTPLPPLEDWPTNPAFPTTSSTEPFEASFSFGDMPARKVPPPPGRKDSSRVEKKVPNTRQKPPSTRSSSTRDSSSSSETQSTRVIYIENERDLEMVVEEFDCLTDEFQVTDPEDGSFVPSRGVLAILVLLIVVVAMAIGIYLYFVIRND